MAADGAPVIVALPAEIDTANAGQVHDRLSAAVASGARVVIADLTATCFCDAGGFSSSTGCPRRPVSAASGAPHPPVLPPPPAAASYSS